MKIVQVSAAAMSAVRSKQGKRLTGIIYAGTICDRRIKDAKRF